MRWRGRIKGTISDEFEIEIDTDDETEAREAALEEWQYIEFQDLEVVDIEPVPES